MNNLNSILIEGVVDSISIPKHTSKGVPVSTFVVVSTRFGGRGDERVKEVSFFEVEAGGRLAEDFESMGKKGRGVRVVGRLKQERWNGADGKPHSKIKIVAEHVEFRPYFKKNDEDIPEDIEDAEDAEDLREEEQ